jgi:hypothetical protein
MPKAEPSGRGPERDHDIRRAVVGPSVQIFDERPPFLLLGCPPQIEVHFNERERLGGAPREVGMAANDAVPAPLWQRPTARDRFGRTG